jgi:hypothetical protein
MSEMLGFKTGMDLKDNQSRVRVNVITTLWYRQNVVCGACGGAGLDPVDHPVWGPGDGTCPVCRGHGRLCRGWAIVQSIAYAMQFVLIGCCLLLLWALFSPTWFPFIQIAVFAAIDFLALAAVGYVIECAGRSIPSFPLGEDGVE